MKPLAIVVAATVFMLSGCSEAPQQNTPPKQVTPPQPVKGRYALYQMFNAGRGWSGDIQVLRLNSIDLRDVKPERGKAAAWQATFVSPQLGNVRNSSQTRFGA